MYLVSIFDVFRSKFKAHQWNWSAFKILNLAAYAGMTWNAFYFLCPIGGIDVEANKNRMYEENESN